MKKDYLSIETTVFVFPKVVFEVRFDCNYDIEYCYSVSSLMKFKGKERHIISLVTIVLKSFVCKKKMLLLFLTLLKCVIKFRVKRFLASKKLKMSLFKFLSLVATEYTSIVCPKWANVFSVRFEENEV